MSLARKVGRFCKGKRTTKETYMRILMKLSIAALLIGMQATALSSNNYEDLAAEGYRWVNIDGPYASKFEDDAQRLSKNPTRDIKLRLLRAGGAYYLIEGSIVKVLRTDSRTGMAEIQVPDLVPALWTSARFLSQRPIRDAFSMIETPDSIGWTFTDSSSSHSATNDMLKWQQASVSTVSSASPTKDGNTR
jgi:hypothetical protein